MSQLAGFEFYETDAETGRVLAFDETFGDKAMQRYFERVYDLAYEIKDVLQALQAAGGGAPPPSQTGKTVYLAETTIDLQSERDSLKRELLENGHRVLPELPLPLSKAEFEREVQLLLEESDFAVHLVGGELWDGARGSSGLGGRTAERSCGEMLRGERDRAIHLDSPRCPGP